MLIAVGIGLFVAINLIVISLTSRQNFEVQGPEDVLITLTAPFQLAVQRSVYFVSTIWKNYFACVSAARENTVLKQQLTLAEQIENQNRELIVENARLKRFLAFSSTASGTYVAARVIARDPSPWFKTLMIDKGERHGLKKNAPILVPEGIVGQITKVSPNFSRVLLITDRNSAVDALVQTTRARGMVKGNGDSRCSFVYALRKEAIQAGEVIVTSGLDQVFPKGLKIGTVLAVKKDHSRLFQDIIIQTSVDFDKLEEVLVYKQ